MGAALSVVSSSTGRSILAGTKFGVGGASVTWTLAVDRKVPAVARMVTGKLSWVAPCANAADPAVVAAVSTNAACPLLIIDKLGDDAETPSGSSWRLIEI